MSPRPAASAPVVLPFLLSVVLGVVLGMLLGVVALPARAVEAWGLTQLMQALAQGSHARASFVEKKYLPALDAPLESSGELSWQPPGRLEKRTLLPRPESMVLDQNTLTLERGTRRRSVPLQSYPEVGVLVESIRATLAGDTATLQRLYRVAVEGRAEAWTLNLEPLDAQAAALVASLRLGGRRDQVESIEIVQRDGSRSVMTITPQPVVGAAGAAASRPAP